MFFDFSAIDGRDVYKLMTATIVPRPIALVISQDAAGNNNAAPFSFFNIMAADPAVIAIGVGARGKQIKDTAINLLQGEAVQFVVNLVTHSMLEAMNITAADFPPGIDELEQAGLATLPSTLVAPPRVAESPVAFECTTWQVLPLGNERYIVLAHVLAAHIDDAVVIDEARCYVDTEKLDIIGRMHHSSYSRQKDIIHLPRVQPHELIKPHA